ncbi:hypothetical protein Tco_0802968 [Tanacetum coccineum]|uniref:Reverse transcriptase Ty1/copia-type domain-containing protein n=1 Tax=Tanacetum coccineum TaxID=301880 RepID=A0ABQ5A0A6_9ASTR
MLINLKWIFKVKLDEYGNVLKNKAQLVAKGVQISQNPRGIFINQSKYALEMLKKYGLDQCDVVDIPMVERLKLDEDPNGTPVDPTRYRRKAYRIAPYYAFAEADHAGMQSITPEELKHLAELDKE